MSERPQRRLAWRVLRSPGREERIAREREWRRRAEHQVFDEMEEVRELKQMLRTCPVCGWRSTKKRADRIRVDFAQHLSEKHSLAVTEEFEEQMRWEPPAGSRAGSEAGGSRGSSSWRYAPRASGGEGEGA